METTGAAEEENGPSGKALGRWRHGQQVEEEEDGDVEEEGATRGEGALLRSPMMTNLR